jgi:hypothetical protein
MTTISINPEIDASLSDSTIHYDVNGSVASYRSIPCTSWSQNALRWSIIPPSIDTYVNRAIQLVIPLTVTYAGTGAPNLLDDGYDSLRSLADIRLILNSIITFNSTGFPASQCSDVYSEILLHYNRKYKERHPLSAIDLTQQMADQVGWIANPMGTAAATDTWDGGVRRGAYTYKSITRTANSAVINLDLVSWLYLPELLGLDQNEGYGLIGLRNIDVNLTIDLSSKYVMSHAVGGGSTINSCVITLASQPYALCKFISPPVSLLPTSGKLRYKHIRMEKFLTTYGSVTAPLATCQIVGNNIQLPYIPRYLWCYVREQDSSKTITSTDTFLALNQVSIFFNNQNSLLATCTPYDLWTISKECGLLDNMSQFVGTQTSSGWSQVGSVGSVFCAEFGRHISLGDSHLAIGAPGSFNFNLIANATNCNRVSSITNPTLYCIIGYDQDLCIEMPGGLITIETPLVPVQSFASGSGSEDLIKLPYNVDGYTGIASGGSFRSGMKKINQWLKKTQLLSRTGQLASYLPVIGGPIGVASKIAEWKGYGEGGARMTHSELRKRIQEL